MNIKKTFKIGAVFFFCVFLLSGCPGESNMNTATNTAVVVNTNTNNFNTTSNTGVLPNSNTNPTSNTMSQKVQINRDFLNNALKARLQRDDKDVRVSPDLWQKEGWLGVRIGLIYKNDVEFILKAVRDVTDDSLALNNQKLTKNAWKRLSAGVTKDSKCKEVVDQMLSASVENEPLTPPVLKQ
jgi:hypothetical protein